LKSARAEFWEKAKRKEEVNKEKMKKVRIKKRGIKSVGSKLDTV
jgi:uncharacterized protein YjhX (UPF0386 family)